MLCTAGKVCMGIAACPLSICLRSELTSLLRSDTLLRISYSILNSISLSLS